MFTKFTLSMITIILLISLAGCSINNPSSSNANDENNAAQNNPSSTSTDSNSSDNYQMLPVISGKVADLKLDASADGTSQSIKNGQVISISLESNPSTGFGWFATITNSSVLTQMGDPEYLGAAADTSTPVVGAAGTQTFYFQATGTGTTTLTLNYERSWENVPPEKTITLTVEVQ
jgi:inhibitor of cysteine peptidase